MVMRVMRAGAPLAVLILPWLSLVAGTQAITPLAKLRLISRTQARRNEQVATSGVVTHVGKERVSFFIQDGAAAVFVSFPRMPALTRGDQVRVSGHLAPGSFAVDRSRLCRGDGPTGAAPSGGRRSAGPATGQSSLRPGSHRRAAPLDRF